MLFLCESLIVFYQVPVYIYLQYMNNVGACLLGVTLRGQMIFGAGITYLTLRYIKGLGLAVGPMPEVCHAISLVYHFRITIIRCHSDALLLCFVVVLFVLVGCGFVFGRVSFS